MKNNKGITLITLVITIVVLVILTFSISVNIQQYGDIKIKNNFEHDITILEEEINQYYARNKELPILNKYTNTDTFKQYKNVNDNTNYYIIDVRKLEVSLNYGKDFESVTSKLKSEEVSDIIDVYIINEQSHTIYNPKGIEYEGSRYYTKANLYTYISD